MADLREVARSDDAPVIARRVRDDGSVELSTRTLAHRLAGWIRSLARGEPDKESVSLNRLLARQLMATRHGARIIAATEGVGMHGRPLLARDIRCVLQAMESHGPQQIDEFERLSQPNPPSSPKRADPPRSTQPPMATRRARPVDQHSAEHN
jgi:hypothetical protein